jgi:hypothetical protein
MTTDQQRAAVLEANVQRLFGRLGAKAAVSQFDRARILALLLQTPATPQAQPTRSGERRWVRWAGMAAVLLIATAVLTVDRFDPAESRGTKVVTEQGRTPGRTTPSHTMLAGFAIHLLATGPGFGVVEAAGPGGGETLYVRSERHVSEADVASAWVESADPGCRVGIRLTADGTRKLAELTRNHVGDRLALVLDGQVVMSPTIRSEISQGLVVLTGDFSVARCEEIARGLSAGS